MKYPKLKPALRTEQGTPRTAALFHELHAGGIDQSIYTLGDEDVVKHGKLLYSAKKIYMECEDLTEYEAGMALVGNYKHWKKMRANRMLAPYFDEWQEELEIKLRARGLKQIKAIAHSEDSPGTALNAAKFIANREWEKKRGRPSKEEITRETRIQAGISKTVDDDYDRLFEGKVN